MFSDRRHSAEKWMSDSGVEQPLPMIFADRNTFAVPRKMHFFDLMPINVGVFHYIFELLFHLSIPSIEW